MTGLNRTKLLVASAAILAILSCSIDGFTPFVGLRPHLQTALPTSIELYAKKKKKVDTAGKGFGAVVEIEKPKSIAAMTKVQLKEECRNRGLKVGGNKSDLLERLKQADEVEEEVVAEAVSPISPEELQKFEDLAEEKKAAEIFQRRLLAQKLKNDSKVVFAEPESEQEPEPDLNESFQRQLLAQKLEYDTKADLAEQKKAAEIFQRSLLAQKLKNDSKVVVAEPEPEQEPEPDVNESFQRQLLAQKLEYDTKADLAEQKKAAEIFQRSLLAQKLKNDSKVVVVEQEQEPDSDQRIQPLNAVQEASVASKYAAIADVGERAFEILSDLGFFNRKE